MELITSTKVTKYSHLLCDCIAKVQTSPNFEFVASYLASFGADLPNKLEVQAWRHSFGEPEWSAYPQEDLWKQFLFNHFSSILPSFDPCFAGCLGMGKHGLPLEPLQECLGTQGSINIINLYSICYMLPMHAVCMHHPDLNHSTCM